MPKPSRTTFIWSETQQRYELRVQGQSEQHFFPEDELAFSRWLNGQTSFAFVGQSGRISVLKEARRRGTGYWYAYRKQDRHTHKSYLGSSERLTFARLEEVARLLGGQSSARPLARSAPEKKKDTALHQACSSAFAQFFSGASSSAPLSGRHLDLSPDSYLCLCWKREDDSALSMGKQV